MSSEGLNRHLIVRMWLTIVAGDCVPDDHGQLRGDEWRLREVLHAQAFSVMCGGEGAAQGYVRVHSKACGRLACGWHSLQTREPWHVLTICP
jgi:hypothetical protein